MNRHACLKESVRTMLIVALGCSTVSCSHSAEPDRPSPSPLSAKGGSNRDFEDGTVGQAPPGFTAAVLGAGGPARWEVQAAKDAPSAGKVVTQLSDDRTNARYPQLILDGFSARDVDLSVRFKTLAGEVDASGGLVFRYQDEKNFYVVRANSLEGNVVAYKTEKGRRSNIGVKGKGEAYGVKAEVPHRSWNTLRVIARGGRFEIHLNGTKLFEVENDTFSKAGKVGLWTKADAVTQFDDLVASSLDAP